MVESSALSNREPRFFCSITVNFRKGEIWKFEVLWLEQVMQDVRYFNVVRWCYQNTSDSQTQTA